MGKPHNNDVGLRISGRHYLIPVVLLLFDSEDRVDMVFKQLIRQLTQAGMVLQGTETS